MILEIKFFHKQKFLKNARCRLEKEHKIEATTMVNIKEIPKEDLLTACKCSWLDKDGKRQERIFRYYNGRFWKEYEGIPEVYSRKEMLDYDPEEDWRNRDFDVDEKLYQESRDAGTIVLKEDNLEEMVKWVQLFAQEFICCDGKCWKAVPEPTVRIEDNGRLGLYQEGKRLAGKKTYNLNDFNWRQHDDCQMEMFMPEAFVYGYNEQKFFDSVKYIVDHTWPSKEFVDDKVGGKLLEKVLPLIVQKVKGYNAPAYRFEREDVLNAMDDILNSFASEGRVAINLPRHAVNTDMRRRFLMDFSGAELSTQVNKYAREHNCTPVQIQASSGRKAGLTVLFEEL